MNRDSSAEALPSHHRQQPRRERLAELHAPLVERVDVPDRALHEHLVLVERDQHAERLRVEAAVDERVATGGCRETPCAGTSCSSAAPRKPGLRQLRAHLRLRLAEGERLGLREAVGDELGVVVAELLVRLGGDRKSAGHDLGALVQQLVEGVLAVGAGLAPDDRAGAVLDELASRASRACRSIPCRAAADARRSARAAGRRASTAWVRKSQTLRYQMPSSAHDDRHVLGERRVAEMLVHRARAGEEASKVLGADRDGERQADRRPDRIAPADPVPEAEDAVRPDAELGDLRRDWWRWRRSGRRPPPRRSR